MIAEAFFKDYFRLTEETQKQYTEFLYILHPAPYVNTLHKIIELLSKLRN